MTRLPDVHIYGLDESLLIVTAHNFKRRNGTLPTWYQKKEGKTVIDTHRIFALRDMSRRIWKYGSDDLYFMLTYHLGINDNILSKIMAFRSEKYKSAASWNTFFAITLFKMPDMEVPNQEYTMLYDFDRIATKLVNEYIRFIDQKKFDKFSDEMQGILKHRVN